jgi:radical SAM superfamily enzyme YgiQ (UPF0313 family)
MKVKFILPALLEATDPGFRPIKYALFPPLGLASLAGYLAPDDEAVLEDEHVMPLDLHDEPDLVVMSVYITSAKRAYQLAAHYRSRGSHVALGGLHVSSLPDEAARHADTIFIGPGEDTWPTFLDDFRRGKPAPRYVSQRRSLVGAPPIRRDLIDRRRYLCPNSIVVSRGCPHHCDFCYKDAFYQGGISFYTQQVDDALAEIDRMPGKHVYFLDDHLLGNPRFARALFDGMRGMGRVFQGASTVDAILRSDLIEHAARAGMRSVFVGLETINEENLRLHAKRQNLARDYDAVIHRVHDLGIMINASFVFGLDDDGPDVFDRTVDWAVSRSIETATFHIMTPYPGTALHDRVAAEGRITDDDWDHYDTRHVVYRPLGMDPAELLAGYHRAYRDFYRWGSIFRGALGQTTIHRTMRHLAYAGGWKRLEPVWDAIIRSRKVSAMLPLLEATLDAFGRARGDRTGLQHPRAREDGGGVQEVAVRGAERVGIADSDARVEQSRHGGMWPGHGGADPVARAGGPQDRERGSDGISARGERRMIQPAARLRELAARPADRDVLAIERDDEARSVGQARIEREVGRSVDAGPVPR